MTSREREVGGGGGDTESMWSCTLACMLKKLLTCCVCRHMHGQIINDSAGMLEKYDIRFDLTLMHCDSNSKTVQSLVQYTWRITVRVQVEKMWQVNTLTSQIGI